MSGFSSRNCGEVSCEIVAGVNGKDETVQAWYPEHRPTRLTSGAQFVLSATVLAEDSAVRDSNDVLKKS